MQEVICSPIVETAVLLDSSIKTNGDYNVEVNGEYVLVMSKELENYHGEYVGVTLLDREGAIKLRKEIEFMVDNGEYNQWYENALVRAIFAENFKLKYVDVCEYEWTEIDDVNDLAYAKRIHEGEKKVES